MKIEHIAIWTYNLEGLKDYYCQYFGGQSNSKYINEKKQFESYFISFETGARLELMSPCNHNVSEYIHHFQFTVHHGRFWLSTHGTRQVNE